MGIGIATLLVFYRQLNVMQTQLDDAETDSRISDLRSRQQQQTAQAQVDAIKKQIRQDQRAWAGAIESGPLTITNAEVSLPVRINVIGKTPARDVRGIFFLEQVAKGAPVKLNPPNVAPNKPSNFVLGGLLFPGQGADLTVYRVDKTAKRIPFSPGEFRELQEGRSFIIIYGDIIYWDVFGTRHWTQFCTWKYLKPGNYNAVGCTEHNNADND